MREPDFLEFCKTNILSPIDVVNYCADSDKNSNKNDKNIDKLKKIAYKNDIKSPKRIKMGHDASVDFENKIAKFLNVHNIQYYTEEEFLKRHRLNAA